LPRRGITDSPGHGFHGITDSTGWHPRGEVAVPATAVSSAAGVAGFWEGGAASNASFDSLELVQKTTARDAWLPCRSGAKCEVNVGYNDVRFDYRHSVLTYQALCPKRATKNPWAFFSRPLIRGGYRCPGVFCCPFWAEGVICRLEYGGLGSVTTQPAASTNAPSR
jgi:hypothetical protein